MVKKGQNFVHVNIEWPPVLGTKQPIFTMLFYCINAPACSSPHYSNQPLIVASKWDTVWTSTSTGIWSTQGQKLDFQNHLTKDTCSTYASCGRSSYSTSF